MNTIRTRLLVPKVQSALTHTHFKPLQATTWQHTRFFSSHLTHLFCRCNVQYQLHAFGALGVEGQGQHVVHSELSVIQRTPLQGYQMRSFFGLCEYVVCVCVCVCVYNKVHKCGEWRGMCTSRYLGIKSVVHCNCAFTHVCVCTQTCLSWSNRCVAFWKGEATTENTLA